MSSPHRAHPCAASPLQRGQVTVEYTIVAAVIAFALFVALPGEERSALSLLIQALQDAWATYSYTLSFPL